MDQSPAIRRASTLLALRDAPHGVEVLMVRRNLNSDFVGGAYVFPGGALDPEDVGERVAARCRGVDDATASRALSLESGGLAFLVAGARELFEEAGLLLGVDADGAPARLEDVERWGRNRRARNDGAEGFAELLEREGIYLDLGDVAYLAHWVTPVGPPRRFDTRFFVARAPEGQRADHDAGETVASAWLRPVDALDAHARGEFDMIFPTIRTLESIRHLATVDGVLSFARGQGTVTRVEPRIVVRDDTVVILIPGDPGYDEA
ncbi:MAG: NUDIX hydrolase [Acidimicrobiales bacterium]